MFVVFQGIFRGHHGVQRRLRARVGPGRHAHVHMRRAAGDRAAGQLRVHVAVTATPPTAPASRELTAVAAGVRELAARMLPGSKLAEHNQGGRQAQMESN